MSKTKGRVAVAMSGGVDSSTTAALLKDQGYDVIGLTMHLWDPTQDGQGGCGRCCSLDDIHDARRVADQIGIPHYLVNFRKAFEEEVIQDFVEEYGRGRTPNPCIRCNERIKFKLLLHKAEELGAAALATGHYARIAREGGRALLLRGLDRNKDQSYFLFTLTQEQMAKVLFPLGEMSKGEVREKALALGLRVAEKPDSQEICFIVDDYKPFVSRRLNAESARPGKIVSRQGQVLGGHQGLFSYTIGQRRGLGIAGPEPYFVVALDPARNCVVVGTKEELMAGGLEAGEMNWISIPRLDGPLEALVQIRYRHPGVSALLSPLDGGRVRAEFRTPQKSVTPGQAAVFYRGEEVLGGGWIERAL